jgi:predicted nucleotidyltransferase
MCDLEILRAREPEIRQVAARHGAGNLRVFGSIARGDARPDSDIDLLIDIVGPTSPWFPVLLVDLALLKDLSANAYRTVQFITVREVKCKKFKGVQTRNHWPFTGDGSLQLWQARPATHRMIPKVGDVHVRLVNPNTALHTCNLLSFGKCISETIKAVNQICHKGVNLTP